MTDNIKNLVKDFLGKYDLKNLDISQIVKELTVDEIMAMISGKGEYVVKRSGKLEKYDEEKLARSILNAADGSEMPLNSSDLSLILNDIAKRLFSNGTPVQETSLVKDIVRNVLKEDGYNKILESYDSYVKNQN